MKSQDLSTALEKIDSLAAKFAGWSKQDVFPPASIGSFDVTRLPAGGQFFDLPALRAFLSEWTSGQKIQGWLLFMDQIVTWDGTDQAIPNDFLLAGEFFRPSDQLSLALRHTPAGWVAEEMRPTPLNSDPALGRFFLERVEQLAEPNHPTNVSAPPGRKFLAYEVLWRMDENSPSPAFQPAAFRFTGWL